jgi:hypothetical protein
MKFVKSLACAAISGVVLLFANHVSAQSDRGGYATVVRIEGEARYSAGDNVWHPLIVGQTLRSGNVIQSAADSKVDIVLGERLNKQVVPVPDKVAPAADSNVRGLVSYRAATQQNVIRMESDTVLAIDKLMVSDTGVDAVSDTELDLRQGTIFGNVKKLSAASQYLIKTPNGIAGVRGTTFILSANGDITVISGSMVASHTDRNGQVSTVVLGPGDQYNPRTGQVTQLTPQELRRSERTAIFTVTVVDGIISFAHDRTILYISPTSNEVSSSSGGGTD